MRSGQAELRIGRRTFLGGGAAALALAGFSACGFRIGGRSQDERALRIANWPLYVDQAVLEDFEQSSGMTVEYTEEINDNDEYFATIAEPLRQGRSIGRDIIVVSDWMVAKLVRLGWAAEIDKTAVPRWENVSAELKDAPGDPGRTHSLPWMAGMTGLAYDVSKTGRELTKTADLFDPAFAGHVGMLTEMEDTLGLVMLSMGHDPASATFEQAQAAAGRIREARDGGQIRRFTGNDYGDDLVRGDLWVAIAWSGDVVQLARDNENLRFVIPDDGGILWSDDMVVPKTAENPSGAFEFMNFVYDREVNARLVSEIEYISPLSDMTNALDDLDPALSQDPLVNPTDDLRSRLHAFRPLDEDERKRFSELFAEVVHA